MRERLERLAALDHREDLTKVRPHRAGEVDPLIAAELAGVERLAVELDAVDGAQDLVERPSAEDGRGLFGEPVRLAKLDPA